MLTNGTSEPDSRFDALLRSPLTFHRDEARHAFFEAGPHEPVFDGRSNTWMVTDPLQCVTILTTMPVIPTPTQPVKFQEKFGVDLEQFAILDKKTPLYLEGDEHKQARRGIAEFIASRRKEIRQWFESGLAECYRPLGRPGRVEVMSEIMQPMIIGFLTAFIGVDMRKVDISMVSLLIDNSLRLRKRLQGIEQVVKLKEYLHEQTGLALESDQLNLTALMTLFGKDSLTSTFGESLRWQILNQPGVRFGDMTFKESPPANGVPYSDRVVTAPFEIGEAKFLPGQHVRLFIQAFQYYDDMMQTHRYFGAGPHVCPGRAISVEFWQGIAAALGKFDTLPRIVTYEVETGNHFFTAPKTLLLEMTS